ncbi:MAG: hypothetical protein COV67_12165 [Nitrospinae bacterium CG11_big_fil_rev_8_21_14_0_20_56_8]|nr:MAG: hypothetical protein COV67_12165 [Nitrospinae bacterium CG11_big_fil_rev_8_21_14_0_20_56_8]
MLVFKKNLYAPFSGAYSENPDTLPDPYGFVLHALASDRDIFVSLREIDPQEALEHCQTLYPRASRFATPAILNTTSKILLEGLVNPNRWYTMNAYHFCYLFDTLYSVVEDYNYGEIQQRFATFPELNGEPINFDRFIEDYFFTTAFLIDPERFNNMEQDAKKNHPFDFPGLFGVINRLVPTSEEIRLVEFPGDPYAISQIPN